MQINLTSLKRWLPFIGLMAMAIMILIRMLVYGSTSTYQTESTDTALMYREACSGCHGLQGKSVHFYIPDLVNETLTAAEVKIQILNGGLFMPAFRKLTSIQIDELSMYIINKSFK